MKKLIRGAFAVVLSLAMLVSGVLCASAATKTYTDVKSSDWFAEYVNYMSDKGIINGYTNNTFRPNNEVKRSEFIKMMVETFGLDAEIGISYTDVSSGDWYYSYYRKAAAQGFTTEVFQSSKTMLPEQPLQRQEAAALLMAYLNYPADEKASSSSFSDYSSIKSDYRDWVLQAVYAGIIDGFTDNTFRPTATLTRAQAAKILAAAAGTIADGTTVKDLESFSKNLTVTDVGTVQGLTIKGDVIISEGITSGSVNFVGCTVKGKVYNRSSASVIFNDCTLGVLNVDALGASVTMKSDAVADTVNINEYATVTLSSADIYSMNVGENAKQSSVTGTGTIKTLSVKADGFKSAVTPTKITVADNISATIGNVSYRGGFVGSPRTMWLSGKEFLNYETYSAGKIRYYFTTTATAPSSTTFSSLYSAAAYKDEFAVAKGDAAKENTGGASIPVASYPYLVVALVDGTTVNTPVVIDRAKMQEAFSTKPTLSLSGSNEVLKFAAKYSGNLYYYYTQDSVVPATYAEAKAAYDDAALSGTFSVTTTATTTKTLYEITYVDEYDYCVIFFRGTDSEEYTPVIVERSETANGFKNDPEWVYSDADSTYKLTFALSKAGQIKYIYTDLSSNFTMATFEAEYKRLEAANKTGYYGTTGTLKTTDNEYKLGSSKYGEYLVAMFVESTGTKHTPVKLTVKMSGNGFTVAPVVYANSATGSEFFCFTPAKSGTVRYIHLTKNQAFTVESFSQAFATAASEYTGTISCDAGSANNSKKSIVKNYPYVAFMLVSNEGKAYNPVVVQKKTGSNGFNSTPVITTVSDVTGGGFATTITADALNELQLEYFGENDLTIVNDITGENFDRWGGNLIKTTETHSVAEFKKGVALDDMGDYKYIVIRAKLVLQSGEFKFTPVVVTNNIVNYGVKVSHLTAEDGIVKVHMALPHGTVTGTLRFCFADSIPKTAAEFNSLYSKTASAATGSTEITLPGKTEFVSCRLTDIVDYKYFVYLFNDGTGVYSPNYCVNLEDSILQALDSVGVLDNKLVFSSTINNYKIAWFYSSTEIKDITTATFKTKYNSSLSSYKGTTGVNEEYEFTKSTINAPNQDKNKVYLYFAVIDSLGNYYKPICVELPKA
ncbi:MAG: S-layer homology domain-containing protein [Eubacteriales bacterium]